MSLKLQIEIDLSQPNAEATRLRAIADQLDSGTFTLSPAITGNKEGDRLSQPGGSTYEGAKRGPSGISEAILAELQLAGVGLTVREISNRIRANGREITSGQITKSVWRLKSLGKLLSLGDKRDPKNFKWVHPASLIPPIFLDRDEAERQNEEADDEHR